MIPDYINCQNEEIIVCDYYMTSQCKETCAYAIDIKRGGVKSKLVDPKNRITKGLIDKLFFEDMNDY